MNPLDNRKRLIAFAEKMSNQTPPSEAEYAFLKNAFYRIGNGEDANYVLGVKFGRGQSLSDAKQRQALSFIIMWIESAIQPVDGENPGLGYSVSEACEKAAPVLRKMLGVEDTDKYDAEYIRQCYYKKEFEHMRSETRGVFDRDSPF